MGSRKKLSDLPRTLRKKGEGNQLTEIEWMSLLFVPFLFVFPPRFFPLRPPPLVAAAAAGAAAASAARATRRTYVHHGHVVALPTAKIEFAPGPPQICVSSPAHGIVQFSERP